MSAQPLRGSDSTGGSDSAELPSKRRLFCPECDHESPIAGDWILEVHEAADEEWLGYRCPECGTIISRRRL